MALGGQRVGDALAADPFPGSSRRAWGRPRSLGCECSPRSLRPSQARRSLPQEKGRPADLFSCFLWPVPAQTLNRSRNPAARSGSPVMSRLAGDAFGAERLDPGRLGAAHAGVGVRRVAALDACAAVLADERVVLGPVVVASAIVSASRPSARRRGVRQQRREPEAGADVDPLVVARARPLRAQLPAGELADRLAERVALLGQLEVDARRQRAAAAARDQARVGHPRQTRLERARRDAGEPTAQRLQAQRAGGEVADDHHHPAVADDAQRASIRCPLSARLAALVSSWHVPPPARPSTHAILASATARARRRLTSQVNSLQRGTYEFPDPSVTIPKSGITRFGFGRGRRGVGVQRRRLALSRSAARAGQLVDRHEAIATRA